MTNKQIGEFSRIEKSIPLTREEYWRLLSSVEIESSIQEAIMDLLIRASTKLTDRKRAMWDRLAQQFGFEDHLDARSKGKIIEISWANKVINLRSSGENEEAGSK